MSDLFCVNRRQKRDFRVADVDEFQGFEQNVGGFVGPVKNCVKMSNYVIVTKSIVISKLKEGLVKMRK